MTTRPYDPGVFPRMSALLVLLLTGLAHAIPCEDYSRYCGWVGVIPLPGLTLGVEVAGDVACVASGSAGLRLLNISDPSQPILLGTANTPGNAEHVAVDGEIAFVADREGGLQVIDISDPMEPLMIGSHATLGDARDVCLADDLAFVAVDDAGLQIFDVSNPTAPQPMASLSLPGSAAGVHVENDLVFVGLSYDGFAVVDASAPSAPLLRSALDTPGSVWDVTAVGTTLFVPDHSYGLRVYDVSDPDAPILEYQAGTGGFAVDVAVLGDRLYVSDNWQEGVIIFDISQPTSPVQLAFVAAGGGAREVALAGEYAYVATYYNGIQVLDVSGLVVPVPTLGFLQSAGSVAGSGSILYMANSSELLVVDTSDPTAPGILGSTGTGYSIQDIAVDQGLLVAAVGTAGFLVFDVHDPLAPLLVGTLDLPGYAVNVAIQDGLAFLLTRYDGLSVIDISDPSAPMVLSSMSLSLMGNGIACRDDLLYVLNGASLRTLDVSDPWAPSLIDFFPHDAEFYGIALEGDRAFLSGHDSSDMVGFLMVFDLTDPRAPEPVGELSLPWMTWGLDVHQGLAYVVNSDTGFHVIDASDPAALRHIGNAVPAGRTFSVCCLDGTVAVIDGTLGLYPLQCGGMVATLEPTPGPGPLRLAVAPNPFNPATEISFSMPRGGLVSLDIHDLSGRLVTRLEAGAYGPGTHAVSWNGTDRAGRPAASGVYMVVLETSEGIARSKIALIR